MSGESNMSPSRWIHVASLGLELQKRTVSPYILRILPSGTWITSVWLMSSSRPVHSAAQSPITGHSSRFHGRLEVIL